MNDDKRTEGAEFVVEFAAFALSWKVRGEYLHTVKDTDPISDVERRIASMPAASANGSAFGQPVIQPEGLTRQGVIDLAVQRKPAPLTINRILEVRIDNPHQ